MQSHSIVFSIGVVPSYSTVTIMENFFKNKVFVITGASSGLGRLLALRLASLGCRLVLFSRRQEALDQVAQEIQTTSHDKVLTICGDVGNDQEVAECIQKTLKRFHSIDGMILCAGRSMWKKFLDLKSPREMENIMQTNYWGVVNFCYHGIPHLKKNQGKLIVISSLQAMVGVPYHSGYSASKHALNGFIEAIRLEEEVDILNVMVSWMEGTSLRKNSLGVKRQTQSHQNTTLPKTATKGSYSSMPVEECVDQIITSIPKKQQVLYLPKMVYWLPLVKFFFPNWLEKKIRKTIAKEID